MLDQTLIPAPVEPKSSSVHERAKRDVRRLFNNQLLNLQIVQAGIYHKYFIDMTPADYKFYISLIKELA